MKPLCFILFLLTLLTSSFSQIKGERIQFLPAISERPVYKEPFTVATSDFVMLYGGWKEGKWHTPNWQKEGWIFRFEGAWERMNAPPQDFPDKIRLYTEYGFYGMPTGSAVADGRYLYVWGNSYSPSSRLPFGESNEGWIFDAKENRWQATPLAGAPFPRMNHLIISTGSGFLIYGGVTSPKVDWPPRPLLQRASFVTQVIDSPPVDPLGAGYVEPIFDGGIYDLETKRWTPVKGPEGWVVQKGIQSNRKIVCLMFKHRNEGQRAVFVFDLDTKSWSDPIPLESCIVACRFTSAKAEVADGIAGYLCWPEQDISILYLPEGQSKTFAGLPNSSLGQSPAMGFLDDSVVFFDLRTYKPGAKAEAYQAWRFDFSRILWSEVPIPDSIPLWQDRACHYIPQKKSFLILNTGTQTDSSGVLWSPWQ